MGIWPSLIILATELSRLLDGQAASVDSRHTDWVHYPVVPEGVLLAPLRYAHQWMIGILCTGTRSVAASTV